MAGNFLNNLSKAAPIIDAGTQVAGGIINGLFARKAATTAFRRQKHLIDVQQANQHELNQSAESERINSIRAAGMNPLMYDGGSAPSAAGGTAPQASTPDFRPNLSVTDKLRVSKELEQMQAGIEATNAERDLKKSQQIAQDIRNAVDKQWLSRTTERQFEYLGTQIGLNEQDTEQKRIFNEHAHEIYVEQANQMREGANLSRKQADYTDKQTSWLDRLNQSAIERAATANKKDLASAAQSYAMVKNLVAMTEKIESETDLNVQLHEFLAKKNPKELEQMQADIDNLNKDLDLKDKDAARKEIENRMKAIEERYFDRKLSDEQRQRAADYILTSMRSVESGTRSASNIINSLIPWQ